VLLQNPDNDLRVLRLTREDEKQLLHRLENLRSYDDLKHIEARMAEQVGIQLSISISPHEVRSLRGITILVHEQPGLCRKTRQSIPAAIKRSLEQQPQIAFEILNRGGLFEGYESQGNLLS
jgi:capsid protein